MKNEGRCPVLTPSKKREIRQFHVVVVQRRQEMYKKALSTCKVVVLNQLLFSGVFVAVAVTVG